jgi:hypothetical protein
MEPTISTAELIRHLGASAREIASLRLLFGQDDDFDRANAALALQRLRQHAKPEGEDVPMAPPKRGSNQQAYLLRRLRGSNRRVPVEVRRDA